MPRELASNSSRRVKAGISSSDSPAVAEMKLISFRAQQYASLHQNTDGVVLQQHMRK